MKKFIKRFLASIAIFFVILAHLFFWVVSGIWTKSGMTGGIAKWGDGK